MKTDNTQDRFLKENCMWHDDKNKEITLVKLEQQISESEVKSRLISRSAVSNRQVFNTRR